MISLTHAHRPKAYVLDRETAPAFWLVGILWLPMATSPQTANRFTLIEQQMQKGPGPTSHSHPYDEGFYVIEGQCTFNPYGENVTLGAGGFLHIPRHAEHVFVVDADDTRVLNYYTPAGFELLMMGTAQLAASRTVPKPDQVAPPPADQVKILCELFGHEIVAGIPFVDRPTPELQQTSPVAWTPAPLLAGHTERIAAIAVLGETWRVLASSEQTAGTYSMCEVTTPNGFRDRTRVLAHDEAIYVIDGAARITLEGREATLRAGSFAYVPAGTAHHIEADAPTRSLRYMLPGGYEGAIEHLATSAGDVAIVDAIQAEMGTRYLD